MLVMSSAEGSTFKPLSNDAKNIAKAFSEEYSKSQINKTELTAALDSGMTVQGPMPQSAVPSALKSGSKSDFIYRDYLPIMSVSDAPIKIFSEYEFENIISYKAATFISEQQKTTFNYEVKRVRALWDPGLSIPGTNRRGGWRCPVGTRYGGQITDRFGRSCGWGVARRIANQIADIGERLEQRDDDKRKRRLDRRNARMVRRLGGVAETGRVEGGLRNIADRLEGGEPSQRGNLLDRVNNEGLAGVINRRINRDRRRNEPTPEIEAPARVPRNRSRDTEPQTAPTPTPTPNPAPRPRPAARRLQPRPRVTPQAGDVDVLTARDASDAGETEDFKPYVLRKYDEYAQRVREIREGGGNAGMLTRREWYAINKENLRDAWKDAHGRSAPQDFEPPAPQARPARQRRRPNLRESEQRRIEREIIEPGAPRTDERAPRNIPARPQRRRPNANERQNVNLLAPESDEVLQGMRREMEADPDFDKENPEYQRVLAEIQRREQVAQGNRTNNRNNRRRASERQAERTATRRPENNPPPAAEAQPQRPARRTRAQAVIADDAQRGQGDFELKPPPANGNPQDNPFDARESKEMFERLNDINAWIKKARKYLDGEGPAPRNFEQMQGNAPGVSEQRTRAELRNLIQERDQIKESLRKRGYADAEQARLDFNRFIKQRRAQPAQSPRPDAAPQAPTPDPTPAAPQAPDRGAQNALPQGWNQGPGTIITHENGDIIDQQAVTNTWFVIHGLPAQDKQGFTNREDAIAWHKQNVLNRNDAPAPDPAPAAPNTQAAFARTAPVSRLSAAIQNAINIPDGSARRQDLEQKVNDLIIGFAEVFPEAERTQVLERLERAAVAAKQNAESDARGRLSTVNTMSFASVNSTIAERKRERETALRAAMTELTALASNREADDVRGRNANEQRLNRIIANLGTVSNLEQRLENLETRKEAVAVLEAERIAREQAEALRQAQLAGPVQPINFAQVRNMAPVFDNAVAKVTAGGNAQKVLDAIDEQEIEVRRAASKTQWNLMVKSIEDSLSAEHGNAIAKIQTLRVRDARKEREARLRGYSDPNGSLRTKEDAEALLANTKERLNTLLADRQIVARQVKEPVYKNTELYKQLTQVGQLQLVVDNWDADSALIHRATSNNPGDEFMNLNDPEVSQRRQAMGPVGEQIQAKISAQIEKRQDVLFNYLDEKYGSANEPYADMTPQKWAALSPTAKKTYLREAYSIGPIKGQNGRTYKSEASVSGSGPNYRIDIRFHEIDSNGNIIAADIGESVRSISLGSNKVYQSRLFINRRGETDKGAGIATLYNQHAFHFLQKIGVTTAEVGPADDGTFVWAKVGFKPDSPLGLGRFQSELDKYAKFGYSPLISSPEEYWRLKYLVEKRPPGTHQEFIFAVSQSRSLPGGSDVGRNRRENQIKNWFKQNAAGGHGFLSFAEQRIGSRRRGQAVAPTPRVTRTRRPRIPVNSDVTPRSLRAPTDGNIR